MFEVQGSCMVSVEQYGLISFCPTNSILTARVRFTCVMMSGTPAANQVDMMGTERCTITAVWIQTHLPWCDTFRGRQLPRTYCSVARDMLTSSKAVGT